jgi:hypothetical protein
MELSARLLGFVPAASLLSHAGFSSLAPGGKTALGFASSRMFGAPFGAFARARPRVDHQPPETASGSYPLMGFSCSDRREVAAKQSPGTLLSGTSFRPRPAKDKPTTTIRCGPSAC